MKVALACTGVDQVQRGFERMFRDLFETLKPDLDVTLFKGGGRSKEREVRVPCIRRTGRLARVLPLHALAGKTPYHAECFTFSIGLHRRLVQGAFDLVHMIDAPLAKMVLRRRDAAGARYRVLYVDGSEIDYAHHPRADFVQHVTKPAYDAAVAHGMSEQGMLYVPPGIHFSRFHTSASRAELRAKHGIRPETFVILDVAAVTRTRKCIDHLVREAEKLSGDFLVWVDGSPEDLDLIAEARAKLGPRCRITHVPSEEIGELYKLSDVLAHPAQKETFCLVLLEAMSTGLPVVCHDAPHFRWMVGHPDGLVDMSEPGALAARLSAMMDNRSLLAELAKKQGDGWKRFDWSVVRLETIAMYERAMAAEPGAYRLTRSSAG
jgi:glycosyltransferase involved in cell wall biosynthesis